MLLGLCYWGYSIGAMLGVGRSWTYVTNAIPWSYHRGMYDVSMMSWWWDKSSYVKGLLEGYVCVGHCWALYGAMCHGAAFRAMLLRYAMESRPVSLSHLGKLFFGAMSQEICHVAAMNLCQCYVSALSIYQELWQSYVTVMSLSSYPTMNVK